MTPPKQNNQAEELNAEKNRPNPNNVHPGECRRCGSAAFFTDPVYEAGRVIRYKFTCMNCSEQEWA